MGEIWAPLRNKHWLALYLLCAGTAVLTYWQSLAEFIPTADDEMLPSELLDALLAQGRFASYALLSIVAPAKGAPTLVLFAALLIFSLSIVTMLYAWAPEIRLPHFAAGLIATTFPTTVHMFEFTSADLVVSCSTMLSVASVFYFKSRKYALSLLSVFISVALYQGLLLNIFLLYVISIIFSLFELRNSLRTIVLQGVLFVSIVLSGLIIYAIVVSIYLWVFQIELLWVQSVLRFDKIFDVDIWRKSFVFLYKMLSGEADLFLGRNIVVGSIQAILVLCAFAGCFRAAPTLVRKILAILALAVVVAAPFLLSIVLTGGDMRYRTLLAAPVTFAAITLISGSFLGDFVCRAVFATAAFGAFIYASISAEVILSAKLSWEADRDLAVRIVERISNVDPDLVSGQKSIPFEMVGSHPNMSPWIKKVGTSTLGYSFFERDASRNRAAAAMVLMGYPKFRPASQEERLTIIDQIAKMPVWPASGSVSVINGIAVVRFNRQYTKLQIDQYCGSSAQCLETFGVLER